MSVYLPLCNWDGHFWPRKKHLFYVAVGNKADWVRSRLRFCSEHVALVEQHLAQYEATLTQLTGRTGDGPWAKCFSCDQPLAEGGAQVFITGYPTQDERKDYWFQIHYSCQLPQYLTNSYSP